MIASEHSIPSDVTPSTALNMPSIAACTHGAARHRISDSRVVIELLHESHTHCQGCVAEQNYVIILSEGANIDIESELFY